MRWLLILAFYSLLAVFATYPLAWRASDMLITQAYNDSLYSLWIFGWQAHQLLIDPLRLFDANIYFPLKNTLAFSEIILPEALGYLPLSLALGNPVLSYNLLLLALFPLNGLAMYLWVYDRLHDSAAALLGGVAFTFSTYVIGELRHVQLVAVLWIPLTLLYGAKFFRRPTNRNLFFACLFFGLNTLTSWYYALFLTIGLALYVGWMLLTRAWSLRQEHLVRLAVGAVALGLVLAPFTLPFLKAESTFQFAAQRNPLTFSARPASYLAVVPTNWIYGPLLRQFFFFWASRGQPLFLGVVTLVLAAIGLLGRPRGWRHERGFWLVLIVVAVVLSFGPSLVLSRENAPLPLPFPLPYAWVQKMPGLSSLGAPARFAVLSLFGLSCLAAAGARVIVNRLSLPHLLVWLVLGSLVLVEHLSIPLDLSPVAVQENVPPVYRYLAQQPSDQPVAELPMGLPTFIDADNYGHYVYYSTYYWHPLVNGYSSFLPAPYAELVEGELRFPYPEAVDRLRELGVVWVIVHSQDAPNLWTFPPAVKAILATQEDITLVAEFDDTWLYRLEY